MVMDSAESDNVVCIGDVHGNINELKLLWQALAEKLGQDGLETATCVFLGDYCDRGPSTSEVLTFLANLRRQRAPGKTVLLCGNHDLGMAAFLGCLPVDDPGAVRPDGLWAVDKDARSTFESYGVTWDKDDPKLAEKLRRAVPQEHVELLESLRWVHDMEVSWSPGRLVCVHAGLDLRLPAEVQIKALKARNLSEAILHQEFSQGRLTAFSGRAHVRPMHPDLEGKAVLISGHHAEFLVEGDRIINDRSGGLVQAGLRKAPGGIIRWVDKMPLEAVLLPSRHVVASQRD